MGAVVAIRDDAVWKAQEPTFNLLTQRIAEELELLDQPLAFLLLEAQVGMQYLDLTPLESNRIKALFQAFERVFNDLAKAGPRSFRGPEAFVDFMFTASELNALLRTDERAEEVTGRTGVITVSEDEDWTAPAWIYDMVLEHFAAKLHSVDRDCALNALTSRVSAGRSTSYNLNLLEENCLQTTIYIANWLFMRYGDAKGRSMIAPALIPQLAAYIIELRALMNER